MRILMASALAVVLAAGACCCGSPDHPVVTATPVGCGRVHVVAEVSAGAPRALTFVSGEHGVLEVDVGLLQTRVEAEVPAAAGSVTVMDGARAGTASFPETEPVVLAMRPVGEPTEGEELALSVRASQAPGCTFAGTAFAAVDGREASAVLVDNAAEVRLSGVGQGEHTVRLALVDAEGLRMAEGEARLSVRPPCVDADGDGVLACDGDCDDADPAVHPGAVDVEGDGIDSDCNGVNGVDRDGDGHEDAAAGGDDCDDRDPAVHAGASTADGDGDGYLPGSPGADLDCDGLPDVRDGLAGDCDDTRASVHPGLAAEPPLGNGLDDDCDGTTDEGTNLYDDDGDGQTESEGDCDDADARKLAGAGEVYDCVDNDCDGTVDEGSEPTEVDDRYEPNDAGPTPLSTATRNWIGGYKPTRDLVAVISRDGGDVEQFSIGAHDGLLDDFAVEVALVEGADRVRYEAVITAPSGATARGVLVEPGSRVRFAGIADHPDSGTYVIRVQPHHSDLAWCPATLLITSR